MIVLKRKQNIWLALLLLVLASNFMLYHSGLGSSILPLKTNGVVMGSLFDFVVVMPVLYMLYKGNSP